MALNDTLTGEGNTLWWLKEMEIQSKRYRRDNDLEDERVDEEDEEEDAEWKGGGARSLTGEQVLDHALLAGEQQGRRRVVAAARTAELQQP